ncbi:MAG: FAD-dependent oxidoreductase [Thermodesulfobacteriota bacterium]
MSRTEPQQVGQEEEALRDFQQELAKLLGQLSQDIPVYLFARKGEGEVFSQAAQQVVQAFQKLTPRVQFHKYDLQHKLARQYNVDRSPTLLLSPERYRVRWLGAPVGEEARTFFEAILLMGLGKSELSGESLKILKKIDSPREIKLFVSPTCPYCPQQAVNALKAAIERPDLISLEIVDIQANPDLARQYDAEGVPQTFANEVLVAQGAQPEELFLASLEKMEHQTIHIPESDAELVEADVVIVGGGPAGITAGIYAARSGLNAAVVEKGALGGQVATTPIVENYPGFTQVGGKALVDFMVSHALQYVQIFQGEEVQDVKQGMPLEVITTRRRFHAKAVLLATGAVYRHLGVPGETRLAGRGVSYCSTCDGPLFKGRKVLMVGGGNSAVTEALHLHHLGVQVTLAHRRDSLRAQDFLMKNIQDNNIPILWNTEVKEIRGQERVREALLYNNKTGETRTLETDGVFVAIGYEPAVQLARKIGVELAQDGYIKQYPGHRTNIPGIYAAGDVQGGYKQIVTAVGEGAAAAMNVFEDLIHPYWKRG